jgi:poly-gamma-glutamate synthesis protein (capsule biosynthesis protein)
MTLQFFGDVMLDRNVAKVMGKKGLDYLFEKLRGQENRFFNGADLFIVNLEGPFAQKRITTSKSIAFRFDPLLAAQLKKYRFDVVSLANNHTLDMGRANGEFTKKTLDKVNIAHFGEQYAENIKLTYIAGADKTMPEKIAFIGIENVDHSLDMKAVAASIVEAKKETPNVIVYMHSGVEYQRLSSQKQRDLAYSLIDQGAIAVMGAHPHVVEEVEVYNGRPIIYSMGNFIFDQYFSKDTQEGLSVGLTIENNRVSEVRLFPLYGVKSQVFLMTGARRDAFLKWMGGVSRLEGRKIEDGVLAL